MNINEMSDEEKSVMLARLFGIRFYYEPERVATEGHWCATNNDWMVTSTYDLRDIYNPASLELARHVLNVANKSGLLPDQSFVDQLAYMFTYAKDGQREALDMVLALATEGGMVTGGEG